MSAAYGPLVFLAHWMILVNEGLANVEFEHPVDSIDLGCKVVKLVNFWVQRNLKWLEESSRAIPRAT